MSIDMMYVSLLAAAVVSFIYSFLVHGPVFGKVWMDLMGFTPQQIEEGKKKGMAGMAPQMVTALVQQLVVAFVLANFMVVWGADTVQGALIVAFWAWLGFIATTLLNGFLWEGRSFKLFLFSAAYHLGNVALIAIVLVLFG